MSGGSGGSWDFRPGELAAAVALALTVQAGFAVAMVMSNLDKKAVAPEPEVPEERAVKVTPVLDLDTPFLKLGGKRDKMKLPDRWVKQTPKPRVEERAFVSTKAGKEAKDIPEREVRMADAGTPPPPEDAELAKVVDTPIEVEVDAGPEPNVDMEGHSDGVKDGTETDPLKGRAVDLYRARLAGWFSSRFRVGGSGLAADELTKYRVVASVTLTQDRRVAGYSIVPSGNAAFDSAARSMLEGAKGQQLPTPPENYPDIVQSQIQLTLQCRVNQCD